MASLKQLRQERQALESLLTHVENLIKEGNLSKRELGKCYERLTNLVDRYEQLYRKCVDVDVKEGELNELEQLVERYLAIGDKIDSDDTTAVTNDSNRNNDTMNTCDQQIQFRRIEIPKFDGDMGKWLSFKSNFLTLVDARRDLSDLEKHVYLRDALSGQTFQTIQHYQLTGEYYKAAWGALLTAFDIPRILLARAFDALIDIPRPKTRSAKDITAFLNELRSHISTINTFNNLDALLVRLAERALPLDMLQEWNKQTGSNEYPTIEQFFDFLTRSARSSAPLQTPPSSATLARSSAPLQTPPPPATLESRTKRKYPETTTTQSQKRQNTHSTSTSSTRNYCCLCKRDDHDLYRCPQYNNMTKLDRLEAVKRHGVCKNCLRKHRDPCKGSFCRVCHHAHHTSLHIDYDKYEIMKLESQSPAKSGIASTSQTRPVSLRLTPIFHVNLRCEPNELLMSAICGVKRGDKTFKNCRALLDTCATANFITENIAKDLLLPIKPYSIPINAINDTRTLSAGIIERGIQSIHCKFYRRYLSLLVVPKIADQIPSEIFPRRIAPIPSDRKLADPQFHLPRPVEILIGSETTLALMSIGPVFWSQARGDFMLQKTELGWVIVGIKSKEPKLNNTFFATTELKEQLEKFWSLEDTNITRSKSVNEIECENHYVQNTKRDESGRYIVRLPFREEGHDYSNMRSTALRRLQTHWKRLEATPEIRKEYERIMQEYIDLGHMSMVENDLPGGCYIPHFLVFKSTSMKTEVRIVFAASTKNEKKLSLNSTLLVGPTIQDTQVEHLLRFRTYRYVLTANIEKMYRQIWIHPDDRKYQRIFWFHNKQICTFELNTVTFGVASAPFLAMRTIKQLAKDEGANYPLGSEILNRDLYVDDLITGADNVETLGKIRDQIIEILKRGGFNMRQWSSNFRSVLENLDTKNVDVDLCSEDIPILKTIGISWNAHHDRLIYSVTPIDIKEKTTKRRIISEVAKIFDPLGHLSPAILTAKILIQDCWKTHIDWDELVPNALHSSWVTFAEQLTLIDNLTIERRITLDNPIDVQIHGFCGGSQSGYGGCLYIRSRDEFDVISVRLLCAKNCVAPLKDTTIQRLELCGALTLARLYREVRIATGLRSDKVTFWSDSMIVLGWLKRDPGTLKIYTANRVREIQEICEGITWRHVQSENNPADALSRGQLPRDFVMNDLWFYGPSWLKQPEAKWPVPTDKEILELPDVRKLSVLTTRIESENMFQRFSNYTQLLKFVARCRRWLKTNTYKGELSTAEMAETERRVLRIVQSEQFHAEMDRLTDAEGVKSTKLATLNPILDEEDLIRVGGRLRNANLNFQEKYPILLPSYHHVTDLLIQKFHEQNFHAGIQTTLYALRQRFWLLDGKNQVRKIVRNCERCIQFRASGIQNKMDDLPSSQEQEVTAFSHVIVDFFGPIYAKEKKYRNKGCVKIYGCIFVCMTIKAIHIELISDLTTDAFLAAFQRFVSRRAVPTHVYSDNGINFVGANNQLRELYALIESDEYKTKVHNFAVDHKILWHFNPPLSAHFRGMWEAAVKSFKHHFRRVVGKLVFTFKELTKFVIEIEAILNSRPLFPIPSDPNDVTALSPAHFLVEKPITTLSEENYTKLPANQLSSWKHIMKVRKHFWRRWYIEYLRELQKRQKWIHPQHKIEKDTVVILINKNQPCMRWPLGRILNHPREDDVIRVVSVKTTYGIVKRNANTICPLL